MKKIAFALGIVVIFIFNYAVAGLQIYNNKISDNSSQNLNKFYYKEKYAVIIVGTYGGKNQEKVSGSPREQYYMWYTGSTQTQFNILTQKYGFNPNNIYVLLTEIHNEKYIPHPSFDSSKFINYYNSTKENITMVFNLLQTKITTDDLLVIDLINHGGDDGSIKIPIINKRIDRNKGIDAHDTYMALEKANFDDSAVCKAISGRLWNVFNQNRFKNESSSDLKLYDYELSEMTDDIHAYRIIFVLQPCFSGGFINDLSKNNNVIITASREEEMAGNFLGPFSGGLEGAADVNHDNRISLGEAFEYSIKNLDPNEKGTFHPLIDDDRDKIGHEDLSMGDGKIASNIFDLSYEENI